MKYKVIASTFNFYIHIVKYQAKKETQVTKNKFCKVYSDIENYADLLTETKFHDFSMKISFFEIPFLGQIPGFPGE